MGRLISAGIFRIVEVGKEAQVRCPDSPGAVTQHCWSLEQRGRWVHRARGEIGSPTFILYFLFSTG